MGHYWTSMTLIMIFFFFFFPPLRCRWNKLLDVLLLTFTSSINFYSQYVGWCCERSSLEMYIYATFWSLIDIVHTSSGGLVNDELRWRGWKWMKNSTYWSGRWGVRRSRRCARHEIPSAGYSFDHSVGQLVQVLVCNSPWWDLSSKRWALPTKNQSPYCTVNKIHDPRPNCGASCGCSKSFCNLQNVRPDQLRPDVYCTTCDSSSPVI